MSHPAVFLDRDGTLTDVSGFCCRPEDLRLLPNAAAGVKLLREHGFLVIVLTNQSGIARGLFDNPTLCHIHQQLMYLLHKEGAGVNAIYTCPHLPDAGCDCHKPKSGLARQAIASFNIDPSRSFVIGDTGSDVMVGRAIGCPTISVGDNPHWPGQEADYTARDLLEAAIMIVEGKIVARQPG